MEKPSRGSAILSLFLTFMKIGAFTIGGGYAMVPLIEKECVERHTWVTDEEILDMLAIAESTPGVMAVNSATFIGYKVAGFWGSLWATVGVVLPSYLIITVISYFFDLFRQNVWVSYAFEGMRVAIVVLILNAVFSLAKNIKWGKFYGAVTAIVLALSLFTEIDIVVLLLVSAVAGVTRQVLIRRQGGGNPS